MDVTVRATLDERAGTPRGDLVVHGSAACTRGGSPVVPSQANPPKQGVSPKAGGEGSAGCRDGSLSLLRAFAGWYLESRGCIRCQGLSQTPVTCGGATMHMSRCRSAEWMPGGGQPVAGRLWTVQYRVARVNLLHVR